MNAISILEPPSNFDEPPQSLIGESVFRLNLGIPPQTELVRVGLKAFNKGMTGT
jgi:hypothetical protein